MNHNIFWPVYKNLEKEFINLMYQIHIDDDQLDVYSFKITDLILRAATEIETVSKLLYFRYNGGQDDNIKFDYVALEDLNSRFCLDQKVVIISSTNCYLSNRTLYPFKTKKYKMGKEEKDNYPWNKEVYQALKHHRGENIKLGSIRNLFDIMAALFVLNLYFGDTSYDLDKSGTWKNQANDTGSEIFGVKMHKYSSEVPNYHIQKRADFQECVYIKIPKKEYLDFFNSQNKTLLEDLELELKRRMEGYEPSPDLEAQEKEIFRFRVDLDAGRNRLWFQSLDYMTYEAVLNKNQY